MASKRLIKCGVSKAHLKYLGMAKVSEDRENQKAE